MQRLKVTAAEPRATMKMQTNERGLNPTSSTVHLSPASVILSWRKQERLNSSRSLGDSVGLASLLHWTPGSAPPLCSWHSSTGKWKLARLYSWLSTCRLEQYTSIREASGIRADMGAAPPPRSVVSSGGREVGAGDRLSSSFVNVSLSSSTEPEGLVMSSLNTTLASLRRTLKDSLVDLNTKQKYDS